jgi:GT2 family glycosyltransferase
VVPQVCKGLQWLPSPGTWETAGADAGLAISADVLGQPFPAGWYELRGRLSPAAGRIALPSVRLHYAPHSALTELEVLLPEPGRSGRIRVLLLFLEPVESFEFVPSTARAQFRMRNFSIRRVSRLRALCRMLGGPAGMHQGGRLARSLAWARTACRRGLRRATDDLHAGYCERMFSTGTDAYATWVRKYDTIDAAALEGFRQHARVLDGGAPLISVLLHVDGASVQRLRRCVDSVLGQAWKRWELAISCSVAPSSEMAAVLAGYAKDDVRIRIIKAGPDAANATLAAARGEFIALLDDRCELRVHALLCVAEALTADRDLAMLYADEDTITEGGARRDHHFKPEWDPDLLRSCAYASRFVVIQAGLARGVGGLRDEFGRSRNYDLVLRCSERVVDRRIGHIPSILHHMQESRDTHVLSGAANAASGSALRAVTEHLLRIGSDARVEAVGDPPQARIHWPLPRPVPKASLIVPTRDRVGLLRKCVESIFEKTTYPDFELLVVDNRTSEPTALAYLDQLASRERVRVLRYDQPFNYSALNNWAVRQCDGQLIGLVNNDIEVISPDWLDEMASLASRPDTGAVGAMLYYPDDTIQHAGMVLGLSGIAGHIHAGKPRGYSGYHGRARAVQRFSAVTGACLLVRRAAYEAVGGLDEGLPVEFNDVDFCLRLRQHGFNNLWTPFAELYHHESGSRVPEDKAARRTRFAEVALMQARWGDALRTDPAYNPNLSLHERDFGLAFPPRRPGGTDGPISVIGYHGG